MIPRLLMAVAVGLITLSSPTAGDRTIDPPSSKRLLELETRIHAMEATDEEWFQAACIVAQLGEEKQSKLYLKGALTSGFDDIHQLYSHPDLSSLRADGTITDLREQLAAEAADRAVATWRTTFGEDGYLFEREESTGITWITALSPADHTLAKIAIAEELECLQKRLFPDISPMGLVITIPRQEDADVLLSGRDDVGGVYLPDQHRLIARSSGTNLQHEFVHAIHHEQMARAGQVHAAWIQEGLASLMEAYSCGDERTLTILPNERDEIVLVRIRGAGMPPLKTTAGLDTQRFSRGTARRLRYAQARSIMTYLLSQGVLYRWYETYMDRFDEDPTGLDALAEVTGEETKSFERSWRRWVLDGGIGEPSDLPPAPVG